MKCPETTPTKAAKAMFPSDEAPVRRNDALKEKGKGTTCWVSLQNLHLLLLLLFLCVHVYSCNRRNLTASQ